MYVFDLKMNIDNAYLFIKPSKWNPQEDSKQRFLGVIYDTWGSFLS